MAFAGKHEVLTTKTEKELKVQARREIEDEWKAGLLVQKLNNKHQKKPD